MNKEVQEILKMRWKKAILEYAEGIGNVRKVCREFNIHRSAFYKWKKTYGKEGFEGLRRKKPIPNSHPRKYLRKLSIRFLIFDKLTNLVQRELHGIWSATMEFLTCSF